MKMFISAFLLASAISTTSVLAATEVTGDVRCSVVDNYDYEEYTLVVDLKKGLLNESKAFLFDNDSWIEAPLVSALRIYPPRYIFSVGGALGYSATVAADRKGEIVAATVTFETDEETVQLAMKCSLNK